MSRQRAAALVSGNPRLLLSGWGVLGRLTFARELAVEELQSRRRSSWRRRPSLTPSSRATRSGSPSGSWRRDGCRKGGRVQEEFLPGLAKLEAAHGIVLEEAAGAAEDT